jgi:hypothetical protein
MKAVRLLEYGGQLVFDDVPTPTIARDEVLVKVKNTAVNHLDLVEASGTVRQILPINLPWIPGPTRAALPKCRQDFVSEQLRRAAERARSGGRREISSVTGLNGV